MNSTLPRPAKPVSKAVLLLVTFFLGGLGGHKFYTNRIGWGIAYLLLCWTGIPGLVALIEFVIYIFTSEEELNQKYTANPVGLIIGAAAGILGVFIILGILAAIAIPQFAMYRDKAFQTQLRTDMMMLKTAQLVYMADNDTYTSDIGALDFQPSTPDIQVRIISADTDCFLAEGAHPQTQVVIQVDCNGIRE